MRAFSPFRRRNPTVQSPVRLSRPAQFESRLTLAGPLQLICRACGTYTVVTSLEQGQAWAALGCPHTVTAPPAPVGGVVDLLAMASPVTPPVGVSMEIRAAGGL